MQKTASIEPGSAASQASGGQKGDRNRGLLAPAAAFPKGDRVQPPVKARTLENDDLIVCSPIAGHMILEKVAQLGRPIDAPVASGLAAGTSGLAAAVVVHHRAAVLQHRAVEAQRRREHKANVQVGVFIRVHMRQVVIDDRRRDVIHSAAPANSASVPRLVSLVLHAIHNLDQQAGGCKLGSRNPVEEAPADVD